MFRSITIRNLKLYFRDRLSVFYSLLSVLIVIVLYVLFLADLQISAINKATNNVLPEGDVSYLVNSWILAGLLSITTVTSTLGGFGTMVEDRVYKKIMDFKSSPVPRMVYPLANVATAFTVGTVISISGFVAYSALIYLKTGYLFSSGQILECLALICFSSLMNAALMGFMVSFFKTNSAYGSASLIIGSVIGFINGLYVPIGNLPEAVQALIKGLPFWHMASLFRQVLLKEPISLCFGNAPQSVLDGYIYEFGIRFKWGNEVVKPIVSLLFALGVFVLSIILFFINYRRKDTEI